MIPSSKKIYDRSRSHIFQQDNEPCHKAKKVSEYLQRSRVTVIEWPAQSPDLNPIENLWEELFKVVQRK